MTSQSSPALIRTSAKLFSACALLALAALTAPPLLAQDTWVGATSGNWSVGTNWLAGTAPNVGDALVFNGTSNTSTYNDLGANFTLNGLSFSTSAGAFTLAGLEVNTTAGITDSSTSLETISLNLNFAANHSFFVGAGGSADDTGVISGAGGLSKTGNGLLTLSGTNTYIGNTTLTGGLLKEDFTAAGAPANNIIFSSSTLQGSGGTLLVNGSNGTASTQTFNGTFLSAASSSTINATTTGANLPNVNLGAISLSVGGVVVLNGPATSGAFNGTADAPVPATANMTTTNGSAGALLISTNATAASALYATVGLYDFAAGKAGTTTPFPIAGASVAGANGTSLYTNSSGSLPNTISGLFNITGTSTMAHSGTISVTGFRFDTNSGGNQTFSMQQNFNIGGVLITPNVGAFNVLMNQSNGSGDQYEANRNSSGAGATVFWQNNLAGEFTFDGLYANPKTGAGFWIKAGPGTLVWGTSGSANSTAYTGQSYIDGGAEVIQVNADLGAPGTGNTTFLGGGALIAGSTVSLDNAGSNLRPITIQTNGSSLAAVTGDTLTVSGVVSGAANFTVGYGQLAGTGAGTANTQAVFGNGTVVFTNAANSFTGVTSIANGGTLQVASLANGGAASTLGATSNAASNYILNGGALAYSGSVSGNTDRLFTVGPNGATLKENSGSAVTFTNAGSLAFSSANTPASLTLAGTGAGTGTLDATIPDNGSGQTSVTVASSGTWKLAGTNTYSGPTNIVSGTLSLSTITNGGSAGPLGTSSSAPSNLLIGDLGTLKYTGTGATTDRLFQAGSNNSGASTSNPTLDASGTGLITYGNTGAITYGTSGAASVILSLAGTGSGSLAAEVDDTPNGSTELYKAGTGTWTVTNGANSYSVGTEINAGTLKVENGATGSALGSGEVLIDSAGTLAGTGSVAGQVVIGGAGATISPGDNGTGDLDVGSLALSTGGVVAINFASNSTWSSVDVTGGPGSLSITGGGINLFNAGTTNPFKVAGNYTLFFSNETSDPGVTNLSVLNGSASRIYDFSFNGTNGDVNLQIINNIPNFDWENTGNGSWSTGPWTGGTTPNAAGVAAYFTDDYVSANTTVTVDEPITVGSLNFSSTYSYTIASDGTHGIVLDSGVAATPGAINDTVGNHTISAPLGIANGSVNVNASNGRVLTLSGVISDSGSSAAVNFNGLGRVELSAPNTYSGGTNITTGYVDAVGVNTLPSSGTVTVNGGNLGVLANQTIGGLNLANGLITGTGTLSSPGTFLLQNGSLSTPLAGAGSVIVNGIGNIVTMTGPSSYTGSTTVLAGTLVLDGGDNILPAGTSLILGNTLDTTDAGVLQLGSTVHSNVTFSTIASNSTAPNAIVGGLGGAPSVLSLTGNFVNSVTLGGGGSGQNNILVNINGGNVEMDGASTYTGGTSITNNGTMVVDAIGGVGPGVITLNNGTITQNTIADLTSGGRSLSLVGGGGIINVGSNNETYAGTFTGSGPLAINGTSGTVINATGTNPTFSGPLNAENVTLDFAGSNNYGTGNLTLSNASLILTTASSAPVNNIVVNGAATISFNANNIGPGAIFGSGTLTLLSNNGGGSNLGDLNGNMSGFAGTVVINTGELVRMNGASGSALAIWNLQNSSSFNNRNATSTTSPNLLGGLIGTVGTNISGQQTGSGNTYYQIGAAIGSGNSTEFDGSVTDNAPNSAWTGVIIVGNGTQIFGGTGNTYSLGTTILSGTLALKGPGTLGAPSAGGNANITFGTNTTIGGTLDVSLEASPLVLSNLTVVNGNGTIVTGSSNVTIAGTLASGFNSTLSGNVGNVAGTINVNGTVQVSGNTDFFINGNTTGSYNTIALANSGSTLDLVNSILNLTFGYTPSYGDSITLVALNGGSVDDSGLTINPIGLPGGDVIINNLPTTGQIDVVPEPAVWGLALGLMSLAVCRWRKRS